MQIDKFIVNKGKSSVFIDGEFPNPFKGRVAELLFATEHGKMLFLEAILIETFNRFNEMHPVTMSVDIKRFEEHANSDTIVFAAKVRSFVYGKDRFVEGGYATFEQQKERITKTLAYNIEKSIHWLCNHMYAYTFTGLIAKYFPRILKYGYQYEHVNGFSRLAEQVRIETRSDPHNRVTETRIALVQATTHSRATSFLVNDAAISAMFQAICIAHGVNPSYVKGNS